MATKIYLGNPPQYVIDWIKAHSKPVANPKTKIMFADGTSQEYDWSEEINQQTMIDAGLLNGNEYIWIKTPQTVEIGTNVTSIGFYAFSDCSGLTSMTIPSSVTSIGQYAFSNCSRLTSVTIPEGVTSIGSYAFEGCIGLTSVTIPSSVTSIGERTFYSCTSLTSMTFSGKDKSTVQGMANYSWGLTSGCVIHCTDGDITL